LDVEDRNLTRIFQVIILTTSLPLASGTRNDLKPRLFRVNSQAKQTWIAFHDEIERQLGNEQPLAPIRGFASRTPEHALRLSGVLTLVDDLDAQEIDLPHMEAGIALARFYLAESLWLFDASATNPDLVLAEKLLTWAQPHEVIYLRQVYQFGPNSIRDAKTARHIVHILEEHGWLVRIEGGLEIDGTHRREVWRVWHETA
jgi:hypothetical protein